MDLAADVDADDRRVELFVLDQRQQLFVIKRQRLRLILAAVKDRGDSASMTEAAARTFALVVAGFRRKFERDLHDIQLLI